MCVSLRACVRACPRVCVCERVSLYVHLRRAAAQQVDERGVEGHDGVAHVDGVVLLVLAAVWGPGGDKGTREHTDTPSTHNAQYPECPVQTAVRAQHLDQEGPFR